MYIGLTWNLVLTVDTVADFGLIEVIFCFVLICFVLLCFVRCCCLFVCLFESIFLFFYNDLDDDDDTEEHQCAVVYVKWQM